MTTRSVVHTILDAALKVVDYSSEDGRQVHHMSALSETQSKQLVPAGAHQTGVCLLTERDRHREIDLCERGDKTIMHHIPQKGCDCIGLLMSNAFLPKS